MSGFISTIQSIFNGLQQRFNSATCKWCVADYKDYDDGPPYSTDGVNVRQNFTFTFSQVVTAVNAISTGGGGDTPEQAFSALKYLADNWETLGGRSEEDVTRLILWGGDAPSWNSGANGDPHPSRSDVITSLTDANIKVFAINLAGSGSGLDGQAGTDNVANQATAICDATDGQLFNSISAGNQTQVENALCEALATGGS